MFIDNEKYNLAPLNADQFRRGITIIMLSSVLLLLSSGIAMTTFLGIYPWPQLLYVLIEFSGVVLVGNTVFLVWLARRIADRVIQTVEHGSDEQRKSLETKLRVRMPLVFFGFFFQFVVQGVVSANLSLSIFHGYHFDSIFYFYAIYGIIPVFLITAFPVYFYLTDFLGRYLAPKGVDVTVVPLGIKLAILGLFTPLLIDTVLLLYFYDRTGFLSLETIGLWFVLLIVATLGTLVAWRSLRQSLAPMVAYLDHVEQVNGLTTGVPIPRSLDEIGELTHRYARLLASSRGTEDLLTHERSFVNAVLQNAHALILVQDREGRIVRFNRACEDLTERSFEEVQGKFVWDLFMESPEADDVRDNTFLALVREPFARRGRYVNHWTLPGKGRRTIEWSKSALLDSSGYTEYIVSVGIDITEKELSEFSLRHILQLQTAQIDIARQLESAKNYVDVVDAIDSRLNDALGYTGCWLYMPERDSDNQVWSLVSKTHNRLLDAEKSPVLRHVNISDSKILQMIAKTDELIVIEDALTDPRTNKQIIKAAGVRTVVFLPLTIDQRRVGVLGIGTFGEEGIRVPGQNELAFLRTLATQVSVVCERLAHARQLALANDELELRVEERARQLREAHDELLRSERLAVLGKLTATVSHELRNPLGAIRPSTYVLRKKIDPNDETLVNAVQRIERSIERCDYIIEELLDYTRTTRINKSPVDLDEWLKLTVDEFLLPGDIELNVIANLDGRTCEFDSFRMRRVLVNLLENARHALTEEDGKGIQQGAKIEISTQYQTDRFVIQVTDNGSGIADDVMEHIFEPLYSTKNFGVGLGMPAVRQVMDLHDGGIEVSSREGDGTTVTLWLPASANS